MKNLFLFVMLLFVTIGCDNEQPTTVSEGDNNELPTDLPVTEGANDTNMYNPNLDNQPKYADAITDYNSTDSPEDFQHVLGYYVGNFEEKKTTAQKDYRASHFNKINISIDYLTADSVIGHSIVAGNNRPFVGTYDATQQMYVAKEPGDDKYDGIFTFAIDNGSTLKGTWVANNKKLAVTEREYELKRAEFNYNPELQLPEEMTAIELYMAKELRKKMFTKDFGESERWEGEFLTDEVLKYNPSTTELSKEYLENMYKGDLEVLRNSIYARHGYSFANRSMRYIFDNIDWYIPVHADVTKNLTELERKNIALIKRYEGHSERYYDVFGR